MKSSIFIDKLLLGACSMAIVLGLACGAIATAIVTDPAVVLKSDNLASKAVSEKENLTATILEVKGKVNIRFAGKKKPMPAKKGMKVNENQKLVTGPKSFVKFFLSPNQVYTLDSMSMVTIGEATKHKKTGKIKTDIFVRRGRMHFEVHSAGIEHDVNIHRPGSVLSIRGTKGAVNARGKKESTLLYEGSVVVKNRKTKKQIKFGEKK
tara:strand:- start:8898 stop:9521 length:624 start_codon:yes stop_codon:yes gene_type:complete